MYYKVYNLQLKENIIKSLQNKKICNNIINVILTYLFIILKIICINIFKILKRISRELRLDHSF